MNEVHARKDLEKILQGFSVHRVEESRNLQVSRNGVEDALDLYAAFLKLPSVDYEIGTDLQLFDPIPPVDLILTPSEIEVFFSVAMELDVEDEQIIGALTDKLIRNSYQAGYNKFLLQYSHSVLEGEVNLLMNLHGNKDNNLAVTFADFFYCKSIAINAQYLTISFLGDYKNISDTPVGMGARDCTFIFYQDARWVKNRVFSANIKSCIYKTANERTLKRLLRNVYKNQGHKIYFIHPDGSEELKRGD